MAVGIMIMKPILNNSSLLWTLFMRSLAGSASIFLILLFHPLRNKIWKATLSPQNWRPLIPASILGGYIAFMAWTGGMKFTQVSIASALNQMSTIFIFLLGILFLKEKTTKGKIAALLMGVLGSILVLTF
jgi:drug/metabolite transporter (DMT)-like permease